MTDKTTTQSGKEANSGTGTSETKATKEWEAFQRDLDKLGHQLAELGSQGAAIGEHFLESLQARFKDVQSHADTYKRAAEEQIETTRREAETALDEVRASSAAAAKEAARQMWERAQPLRDGAKDVGEGFARAWDELRASFGKAAQRLQTEAGTSTSSEQAPVITNEDRREQS
jgi:hypothetical protein